MNFFSSHIFSFMVLGFGAFLFFMLLAPLETLGWWRNFYRRHEKQAIQLPKMNGVHAHHYVVFLDGIAKVGKHNYDDVEMFLDKLRNSLDNAVVIGHVLPYSVSNRSLTKSRPLSKLWRWLEQRKIKNTSDVLAFCINIRNLFQVLVSADSRYGPIYNLGTARLIIRALLKEGYPIGSGIPITLIGYSGGGQISVGATPYLKELLRAPIDVISLGGVISSDPGLHDVRCLYHLDGSKDFTENIGAVVFPGRWTWAKNSSWNRAKQKGKLTYIPMGPMTHNGKASYLDDACFLDNGLSFIDHTVNTIGLIIREPIRVRTMRIKHGPLEYWFESLRDSWQGKKHLQDAQKPL